MRSRTKPRVDAATIAALFARAGIAGAGDVVPLGAGEYNAVHAVEAGGQRYVIKIAPAESARTLAYERGMMAQEVHYYELLARAGIRVPRIHHADFSRAVIGSDYLIMERLPGATLDRAGLSAAERARAEAALAAMVARLHAVAGDRFGYRQRGLHDTWYLALRSMTADLVEDARRLGKPTRAGERLLGAIDRHRRVLEPVPCALVSFDVWPANILVDRADGALRLAWIDPERCLWGDRIADLVCLDFRHTTLDGKAATLAAYNRAAAEPIVVGDGERIRFALMLGYLALIMEVEKHARYTPLHAGYWRNVIAARMLHARGFAQLGRLA